MEKKITILVRLILSKIKGESHYNTPMLESFFLRWNDFFLEYSVDFLLVPEKYYKHKILTYCKDLFQK